MNFTSRDAGGSHWLNVTTAGLKPSLQPTFSNNFHLSLWPRTNALSQLTLEMLRFSSQRYLKNLNKGFQLMVYGSFWSSYSTNLCLLILAERRYWLTGAREYFALNQHFNLKATSNAFQRIPDFAHLFINRARNNCIMP